MATGVRQAGDFCWINVLSSQPKQAEEFFNRILGWTYTDLPGMGSLISVDGHEIGGLWDLASPNTPPGTPPGIGVMVKVDDADSMVAKATSVGGSSKPAFDIMDVGRMGEIKDPSGAQIDVWQPKKNPGTDADKAHHGAPSWFENYSTDTDKSATFYSDLFGWTPEVMHMPGMDYTTFKLGDVQIAGMMRITGQMTGMEPTWAVYFTVDDIDKTAAEVGKNGGSVFVPPMDIPQVGRFSGLISPQGVKFFAITYVRPS